MRCRQIANLYFYIDGEISVELYDDCTSIGAEVISAFTNAKIHEHVIRCDYPKLLPKHKLWAFRRFEDKTLEDIESYAYESTPLALQYSLLGRVLPSMRGIAMRTKNSSICLIFYINGESTTTLLRMCSDIIQELKNLNSFSEISMDICRLDFPNRLPNHDLDWIYLRKE